MRRRSKEIVVLGRGAKAEPESESTVLDPLAELEAELGAAERDADEKAARRSEAFWASFAATVRRDQLRAAVDRQRRLERDVAALHERAAEVTKQARAASRLEGRARREAEFIPTEALESRLQEVSEAIEPVRVRLEELRLGREDAIFRGRPEGTIVALESEIATTAKRLAKLEAEAETARRERDEAVRRRTDLLHEADVAAAEATRLLDEAQACRERAEALPAEARREAVADRERDARLSELRPSPSNPKAVVFGNGTESGVVDPNGLVHFKDGWVLNPATGAFARFS